MRSVRDLMHRGAPARRVLALLIGLTLVAACGDSASPATTAPTTTTLGTTLAATTTAAGTTAAPATTTTSPATTTTAIPAEVWDLVYISDSLGSGGVPAAYASLIERDLGVSVEVHDLWTGFLNARNILEKLRGKDGGYLTSSGSGRQSLPDLIREAEVIVVAGHPEGSETPGHPWDWNCAIAYEAAPVCGETTEVCGPETWAQYEADLGAIFDEIFALRDGEPVILRTFDWWIPWGPLETWRACDREQPCKRCWVQFSDAIHRAATAHRVPVGGLMVAFSGTDLTLDMPREYCSDSVHHSTEGAAAIAGVLAALGYDPVTP